MIAPPYSTFTEPVGRPSSIDASFLQKKTQLRTSPCVPFKANRPEPEASIEAKSGGPEILTMTLQNHDISQPISSFINHGS